MRESICKSVVTPEKAIINVSFDIFDFKDVKINRGKVISADEFTKLTDFKRYENTKDGISHRCMPGKGGPFFVANSYEHNEYGYSTEIISEITEMIEKRNRKEIEKINGKHIHIGRGRYVYRDI